VGAWFVVVHWVGSKQPLLYYYLYDADLTQAQTESVSQIAQAFYARHSWASLSLLPLHSLASSLLPLSFYNFIASCFSSRAAWNLPELAATIFQSQRFWVLSAVGLAAVPVVVVGIVKTLSTRYAGRTILALYLVPTLLISLIYRIEWGFSLHITCLYHAFILFFWVSVLSKARLLFVALGLGAITLEGVICVLFSDTRFLPVQGIQSAHLTAASVTYLAIYLCLLFLIPAAACSEIARVSPEVGSETPNESRNAVSPALAATLKLLAGLAITAVTIGIYSLYCLRFY
jgi:hypothetical protein